MRLISRDEGHRDNCFAAALMGAPLSCSPADPLGPMARWLAPMLPSGPGQNRISRCIRVGTGTLRSSGALSSRWLSRFGGILLAPFWSGRIGRIRPPNPRPDSFPHSADHVRPSGRPCRIMKPGGVSRISMSLGKESRYVYVDGYDWIFCSLLTRTDFFYAQYDPAAHPAICSSLAWLVYGWVDTLYQVIVLHSVLLPLNSYQLWQDLHRPR
jgi:hypothetical protein